MPQVTPRQTYDYCIIGGGIVGLATALQLAEADPRSSILVLEKELQLAQHQTGHNSGVIHSGIYYQPGSLKAELCKRGAVETKNFCLENGIPVETCGKLLVATSPLELDRMAALKTRAAENGIPVEQLTAEELRRREPAIAGLGALFVPSTGIVDYRRICAAIAERLQNSGVRIEYGSAVTAIRETSRDVTVFTGFHQWNASRLIACAGLQSDRIARLAGAPVEYCIVPFRGEYYRLPPHRTGLIRSLIYPIPDPALPFLGVHLTRMIDGSITVGPNAVLGFAREGYAKLSLNPEDVADMASFPGFWKVLQNNLRSGIEEMRNSLWKPGYLAQCRKYCPGLSLDDLLPHQAGIRAQAVLRDGTLVHDFLFAETERTLHLCNAPSPAATSALPIGQKIVEKLTTSQSCNQCA